MSSSTLNLCVYIYTHTRKFSREQWISLRMLQYLFSFLESLILKDMLSFNKIVQSRCVDCSRPSSTYHPTCSVTSWKSHPLLFLILVTAESFKITLTSLWYFTPKYFIDILISKPFFKYPQKNLILMQCYCSLANFRSCPNNNIFFVLLSFCSVLF